ncbi:TetR/AcrR family transcriptional regulator [Paenibacillus sp. CAA11]|uniref:TetR/AcrR family transcriptional regulator n=1 Tax=Paenibacillus sp. CAA11 TaxID=1532905 RepID=UPI001F38276E|nr:TetR/AcrR family transcriptional regulator [Paenibacillus sp. CAA11]
MTVRDKVFQAAEQLVKTTSCDSVTFAEIARAADVHWTAVRRHFGSKERMRAWFKERQPVFDANHADTKSRVLEAAAQVFSAHGYTNSSLDKVAEHAGLSKGAVYWHFASKQDLFLAILERSYEQQLRLLPGQMQQILSSEDPMFSLVGWLESQFTCLQSGDEQSKLFLEFLVSGREQEIGERLQLLHRNLMTDIGVFLQQMQSRGYLAADVDSYSLALMLDALLKGVLVEWIMDPRPDTLQKLIQTISRILWNGIAAKP